MSLYSWWKGKGPNGFGYGTTAEEVTAGLDLTGKTILVTGVTSGLGQESARVLAMRGARIVGTGRSVDKARDAMQGFPNAPVAVACDLSELATVYAAVEAVRGLDLRLDAIVCNAGIMALPKLEQKEGYELQFFTNHVGHFVLVTELLDRLAERGRVVVLSSTAHNMAPAAGIELDNLSGERDYGDWRAYGQAKLANLLFAKELARRFAGTERAAYAVHPGVIQTGITRHMAGWANVAFALGAPFLKDVHQGAATQCYAAVHPDAAGKSGAYLADCNVAAPSKHGADAALATRLWEATERIVAELRPKVSVA